MKKFTNFFLMFLSLTALSIFFTACTTKQEINNSDAKETDAISDTQPAAQIIAEAQVDFIEFEVTILDDDPNKTKIQLSMNNHQEDLSAYDYKNISKLDGQSAEKWEEESNGIGGHHLEGTLTFPKTENPGTLTLTGLPVGKVVLKFNQAK